MIYNSKKIFLFLLGVFSTAHLFASNAQQRAILRKLKLGALKKAEQAVERVAPNIKSAQSPLFKTDWCTRLEQEALSRLAQAYKLSNAEWKSIETMLNFVKQFNKEKIFSKKRTNYRHDKGIPKHIFDTIKKLLLSQKIEPTSIDIILKKDLGTSGHGDKKIATYA